MHAAPRLEEKGLRVVRVRGEGEGEGDPAHQHEVRAHQLHLHLFLQEEETLILKQCQSFSHQQSPPQSTDTNNNIPSLMHN